MRILVFGFIESRKVTARALTAINTAPDAELVGWVARPRFKQVFEPSGPACPRFEEPFPSEGWSAPLDADPRLGLGDPLADENLRYLLDREKHFSDEYEMTRWRAEIMCRAQEILDATYPDAIVYSDVPHSALSYALYLTAHERGVTTLYFRNGPAPHLFTFCNRIGRSLYEFVSDHAGETKAESSAAAVAFVERLSGSYARAAPPNIRDQLARSTLWSRALQTLRERPRKLFSRAAVADARTNVRRQRLRSAYERRAMSADALPDRFVSLFLHLQPERSTTPEGGFFAQQWVIAHALARDLPDDWRLVVREHPSTFLTGPRLVRSTEFYDALLAIPRVHLASTALDPFELVDRSRAVATVTGSVGLESVVRGTPALLFGDASYRECPGSFHVSEPEALASALQVVLGDLALDRGDVLRFLAEFESSPWVATVDTHGDDIEAAIRSGDAHASVVERMLTYLASTSR
jgi:hypothetical protein